MIPFVASLLLGFVKGWSSPVGVGPMNLETDVYGPIKEEALYRGPLMIFPNVPFGTSAVIFAVDHILDDLKSTTPSSSGDLVARFGDVLFGGVAYESAMRKHGIFAAIGCHAAHNIFVSLGAQARASVMP